MGRSSADYFRGLESDAKLKTKVWTIYRELERAEARIKELEAEIKRLTDLGL